MNNTHYMGKQLRLAQIQTEIKEAESKKNTAVIMMVVSIFILWPLLIFGIFQYNEAKKRIEALNEEKREIMFQDYFDSYNQQQH